MKKLDIQKIINVNTWETGGDSLDFTHTNMKNAIKQAIREVLPEILEYVAENACTTAYYGDGEVVDREEIRNFKDEILQNLGIKED